jgi:hypothetical protein
MMTGLRFVSRIIIGLVFIFSGTVKAIDPLGSAYKFHDYFYAFHLGFLNWLSLPLAILMCTAEFISGFSILTGIRYRTGTWGVLLLMVIFTPLTFILALTNPVSDCGCFGDAIHLTNWQTFGKNVVLIAMAIILFVNRKQVKPVSGLWKEWTITGIAITFFILFSAYNLRYLPVIDFLPYKTGVKIADKMVVPDGVDADAYKTTFIYEKSGVKKEFDLNNYPASDTTWKFVDQKTVLIKKGYQPPIHDFIITSEPGEDITQKILNSKGYSVFMVTKKLAEAGKKRILDGFELGKFSKENRIDFYILTSSPSAEIKDYNNGLQFCQVDETTLKTMVRSNPGYFLLKDGRIMGKWSWANVPGKDWFLNQIKSGQKD